jgi:TldD protein
LQAQGFQVLDSRGETTQQTGSKGDPVWNEALREVVESGSAPDGCVVFLEDREDASVVLDARDGRAAFERSRTCGVAVQEIGGDFRFRADPHVGDIAELVRSGAGGTPAPGSAGKRHRTAVEPRLPVDEAARILEALANATMRLQPDAEIRSRWVGFDQQVHLGRPRRGVLADLRRSRRVRVEAELVRRGRAGHAVAETVLRSDSQEAVQPVLERLAEEVAARVETRLGAETLPDGERRIVFAPGVGGVLVHEVVGHALEADTVLGRVSWLAGGSARAFDGSPELRVVDDPRRGRAAWRFDDEGEAPRATPLVREGRPVGWLHDRTTARLSGRPATGHGRRASFREPVRPRMGCTFLTAGRREPEEALRGLENGIYVRRMESARTDTRTGRAVFRVTDADRIHYGRLVAPLIPHVMWVEAPVALSSVDCVAGDLAFDVCIGSCLHHGQPLAVSVGAPTFRMGLTSVLF